MDLLLVYDVRAVGVGIVAADNFVTSFGLMYSIDHISNLASIMDGGSERVRAVLILHDLLMSNTKFSQ